MYTCESLLPENNIKDLSRTLELSAGSNTHAIYMHGIKCIACVVVAVTCFLLICQCLPHVSVVENTIVEGLKGTVQLEELLVEREADAIDEANLHPW